MKRKVYNVSQMEESDWLAFSTYSAKYYKDHNFKRYESLSANRQTLILLQTKLKEIFITTANKTVPYSYHSSDDTIPKPKNLISCYSVLKKLNAILLQFRTKYLNRTLWPNETEWSSIESSI